MRLGSRACLPACSSSPLPFPQPLRICFLSEAGLGLSDRATKATFLKPLPPVGFSHIGGEWGEGAAPRSQCLRCGPSAPPGPGILCAAPSDGAQEPAGVGGLRQLEGELSGKGPVLAAGREFDGLLCRPRGFSVIPHCVPACSPLTPSDKLLSRRLPVRGKKRQRSGRTPNPWPLGPGGGRS